MFRDEGILLLREIDNFSAGTRKRVEFDLVHYHVVIYRIDGQADLIRVDLHERRPYVRARAAEGALVQAEVESEVVV